ncbi:uncharacterized protein LOC125479754 isoform X1 [Pyrus x bretschneideri]|uniref:uncharacterized protein LOC125479754 isoform X1 n=1 Tax=Pyrus x bretschneideri TaxID=225117 RepID=UPI00202F4817|nr:uncharacterized protein LOC125479754 isoform X1 [Pyrus x bretschneideri]
MQEGESARLRPNLGENRQTLILIFSSFEPYKLSIFGCTVCIFSEFQYRVDGVCIIKLGRHFFSIVAVIFFRISNQNCICLFCFSSSNEAIGFVNVSLTGSFIDAEAWPLTKWPDLIKLLVDGPIWKCIQLLFVLALRVESVKDLLEVEVRSILPVQDVAKIARRAECVVAHLAFSSPSHSLPELKSMVRCMSLSNSSSSLSLSLLSYLLLDSVCVADLQDVHIVLENTIAKLPAAVWKLDWNLKTRFRSVY